MVLKSVLVRKWEAIFLTGETMDEKPYCGVISSKFTLGWMTPSLTQCPKPEIPPENEANNISPGSHELTVGKEAGKFRSRVLCADLLLVEISQYL